MACLAFAAFAIILLLFLMSMKQKYKRVPSIEIGSAVKDEFRNLRGGVDGSTPDVVNVSDSQRNVYHNESFDNDYNDSNEDTY